MSAKVNVSVTAKASKEAVWSVIADFSAIAKYTDSVKFSKSTNDQATGVGAARHCDLAPFGTTEERITEFEPNEHLRVSLYKATGFPVKSSDTTFSLSKIDRNNTKLTFSAEVRPKGGPLAGLIGKRLEKRLPKGARKMLEELAASAEEVKSEVSSE